ncbi:MAG: M55 family metallopeptidase [Candidatus Sumerlaeota bacterium]|nr:M55 family metallopeptidase [Candidatus Sumerlaeota bacterium]
MKIYILADMEGVSGLRVMSQVQSDSPEYAEGRKLMIDEMNAAVDAAFAAGATEVIAADTHGSGVQLRIGEMDARAIYERPNAGRMMPSLDKSFSGVILLGHHARAGTFNGFLDHTMSSMSWFEYRLNGQVMGEIGIEAAYAGHYDVPVIMVSGDEAAAVEATELLGDVECAIVKWGIGRNVAKCLPVRRAHETIRQSITRALAAPERFKPFKPVLPATIELTLYRSDMADDLAVHPDVERVDARAVRRTITTLLDVRRF